MENRVFAKGGESHLRLHLRLAAIADWIVEIAREFHEEVGVQIRCGRVVLDCQHDFAARAAARHLAEVGDAADRIALGEHTGRSERVAKKPGSAFAQSRRVGGKRQPGLVTGDPLRIQMITRSVPPRAPACG